MASSSLNSSSSASLALVLCLNLFFFITLTNCQQNPPTEGPTNPAPGTCPRDSNTLNACANVLNLDHLSIGGPPMRQCCSLIQGLADVDAAVCVCTALRVANIEVDVAFSLILNNCGRTPPSGYRCP